MQSLSLAYLKVRRLVDALLWNSAPRLEIGPLNIRRHDLLAAVPLAMFPPLILFHHFVASLPWTAWLLGLAWTVISASFIGWRAWRLIRASNIKNARDYDRRAKFDLPLEYAASESLLAHQRRQRRTNR
ncbi:hypothetical protein ACFPIF_07140 [Brevundimonas faecalis]